MKVVKNQDSPVCFNAAEAAKYLGVCKKTVETHAKNGTIPHMRIGSRYVFSRAVLDSMLSNGMASSVSTTEIEN